MSRDPGTPLVAVAGIVIVASEPIDHFAAPHGPLRTLCRNPLPSWLVDSTDLLAKRNLTICTKYLSTIPQPSTLQSYLPSNRYTRTRSYGVISNQPRRYRHL